MADQGNVQATVREVEVLSDASLVLLARHIGQEKAIDILVFAMLLNIPTSTIVQIIISVNCDGFTKASESEKVSISEKCVLLWKRMSKDTKTRERLRTLERALKEMDKTDIADSIMERHQQRMELTADVFL